MVAARSAQFVMVTSKFCNLRCKYCYETPDLDDPKALSIEQIERAFLNIRDHYANDPGPLKISFIWHGGEPLLLDPNLYWEAFRLQKQIFAGSPHSIRNTVQTNLTKLDDRRMDLLKNGFDSVGVSLDLAGGLRVNRAGKDVEPQVIANIDRLRTAGIKFGGITVLTKLNLPHLEKIYRFYRALRVPFRVLPLHKGPYAEGQGFEIDAQDTLWAYKKLADLWLADEQLVIVNPLMEHISSLMKTRLTGKTHKLYDKRAWETVQLVDTDGSLYGYSEAFDKNFCWGNIAETPLGELLASEGHERSLRVAEARFQSTCPSCPYLGRGCSGYAVTEGGQEFNDLDENGSIKCTATRGLIAHLEMRLDQSGHRAQTYNTTNKPIARPVPMTTT